MESKQLSLCELRCGLDNNIYVDFLKAIFSKILNKEFSAQHTFSSDSWFIENVHKEFFEDSILSTKSSGKSVVSKIKEFEFSLNAVPNEQNYVSVVFQYYKNTVIEHRLFNRFLDLNKEQIEYEIWIKQDD